MGRFETFLKLLHQVHVQRLAWHKAGHFSLAAHHFFTGPVVAFNDNLAQQILLAFVDLIEQIHDPGLLGELRLDVNPGVDTPNIAVLFNDLFLVGVAVFIAEGQVRVQGQTFTKGGFLNLLHAFKLDAANLVLRPFADHKRDLPVAQITAWFVHCGDGNFEESLTLIIFSQLASILFHLLTRETATDQPKGWRFRTDFRSQNGVARKRIP